MPADPSSAEAAGTLTMHGLPGFAASVGSSPQCRERYAGDVAGIDVKSAVAAGHLLSASAVSFARGLNDTPKIAALLLVGGMLSATNAIAGVAFAIAAGGLISARGVAETMAHRVTDMNAGQGFMANMVTGLLVVGASCLGMPVSTTHVSCGSLFGIGAVTGQGHWNTISRILVAWVTTLPVAAVLGAGFFLVLGLLI